MCVLRVAAALSLRILVSVVGVFFSLKRAQRRQKVCVDICRRSGSTVIGRDKKGRKRQGTREIKPMDEEKKARPNESARSFRESGWFAERARNDAIGCRQERRQRGHFGSDCCVVKPENEGFAAWTKGITGWMTGWHFEGFDADCGRDLLQGRRVKR